MNKPRYIDYQSCIEVLEYEFSKVIKGLRINDETGMFTKHRTIEVIYYTNNGKQCHTYRLYVYKHFDLEQTKLILWDELTGLLQKNFINIGLYPHETIKSTLKKFKRCTFY